MALASSADIDVFLSSHPDWVRIGSEIRRTYSFADFVEAMEFVTRVAVESEKADHHPDIDIRWNKVVLALSTHSEGGLTPKDLWLADGFDHLL